MEQVTCCVCGEWGAHKVKLDISRLRADVRRRHVAGMLAEKYVCSDCVAKCDMCKAHIIRIQSRLCGGKCSHCNALDTSKTKKRKLVHMPQIAKH